MENDRFAKIIAKVVVGLKVETLKVS